MERATEFVDHEGREGFAFDVFSDDEEGFAGFGNLLEDRQQVFEAADFLLVDEDVGTVEGNLEALGAGHEVGREVAFVELHTFDDVEGGFDRFGFFNRDRAVLADLVHRISDDLADGGVPVGGNSGDLSDLRAVFHLLGDVFDFFHERFDGFVDAALEVGWVGTCGDILKTFAIDSFGENGCCGCAVASGVAGFAGDLTNELCAHVFVSVFKLDFLGDGDAVLGDRRATEFFVEDDVAS